MRLHAWIYKSIWTSLFVAFTIIGIILYDITLGKEDKNIDRYTFNKTNESKKPAVTFCHKSKVSPIKADKVLRTLKLDGKIGNESARHDFVTALEVLSSLDTNPELVDNLSPDAIKILNDHKDQLPNILNHVR